MVCVSAKSMFTQHSTKPEKSVYIFGVFTKTENMATAHKPRGELAMTALLSFFKSKTRVVKQSVLSRMLPHSIDFNILFQ